MDNTTYNINNAVKVNKAFGNDENTVERLRIGKESFTDQMKNKYGLVWKKSNDIYLALGDKLSCIEYIKLNIPYEDAEKLYEIIHNFDPMNPCEMFTPISSVEDIPYVENKDNEGWIQQEATEQNLQVHEVLKIFLEEEARLNENMYDDDDFYEIVKDRVHYTILNNKGVFKKQEKSEVLIEIPEYNFTFTIKYDGNYKIFIPNYALPYTCKRTLLEINRSRDTDLFTHLNVFVELKKMKQRE